MTRMVALLDTVGFFCFLFSGCFFFFGGGMGETTSAQHDLPLLPLKCQGLGKQLTPEPEPSGFCSALLVSSPVARGGCLESMWGVLWEKWGWLAFHH